MEDVDAGTQIVAYFDHLLSLERCQHARAGKADRVAAMRN